MSYPTPTPDGLEPKMYDPRIHDPNWKTAGPTSDRQIEHALIALSYNRLTQEQADRVKAYAQARVGTRENLLDTISRAAATLDGLAPEVRRQLSHRTNQP